MSRISNRSAPASEPDVPISTAEYEPDRPSLVRNLIMSVKVFLIGGGILLAIWLIDKNGAGR
jgi:hypothetical protein